MADDKLLRRLVDEMMSLRGEMRDGFTEAKAERGAIRREANSHFDAMYKRLDRLETEYWMLVEAVRKLESEPSTKSDRNDVRRQIEALQAEIARLKERLDEIESESHDA